MFSVREVIEATQAVTAMRDERVTAFSAVVTDTRKITPGVLFLAFKGERFNGEDFVREAVEKGAAGVLVSSSCPGEKTAGLEATVFEAPTDTLTAYQQLALNPLALKTK